MLLFPLHLNLLEQLEGNQRYICPLITAFPLPWKCRPKYSLPKSREQLTWGKNLTSILPPLLPNASPYFPQVIFTHSLSRNPPPKRLFLLLSLSVTGSFPLLLTKPSPTRKSQQKKTKQDLCFEEGHNPLITVI